MIPRREPDSETGLYYYRARYYDPVVARYLNEDSARFGGQDVNLYRYVRNMAVTATDPSGLVTVDPTFRAECLRSLERALTLVRMIALTNARCNCAFSQTDQHHRSLLQLLDDPNVFIRSARKDKQIEVWGMEVWEAGNTELPYPGTKGKPGPIEIRPITCRRGRWAIARSLIHELTHYSLYPNPEAYNETLEYGREDICGVPERIDTVITVRPDP